MKIKIYVLLALLGFVLWGFLQFLFVKNSQNTKVFSSQLFSIIVPLLASFFAIIHYAIDKKISLLEVLKNTYNILALSKFNFLIIVFSAIGLSLSYYLYPVIIQASFKYVVLLGISITVCLAIIGFFISYENDKLIFAFKMSAYEGVGLFFAILGLFLMKLGGKL